MYIIYPEDPVGLYAMGEGLLAKYNVLWFISNDASIYECNIKFKNNIDGFYLPHNYRNNEILISMYDILKEQFIFEQRTIQLCKFYELYCELGVFFFSKKFAVRKMRDKVEKLQTFDHLILTDAVNYINNHPECFI